MGLDIYAGTFVRYYARNWKTATQRFCEENGIKYNVIRANNDETASVEEITDGVHSWQKELKTMLENHKICGLEIWEEDNSKPYYTDKPDWDAFGALLLMTAAKALNRECPAEYRKKSDFDPMINEAADSVLSEWSLYMGVCHYIPFGEYVTFEWLLANGMEAPFAATANLKEELSCMNRLLWNADEQEILGWYNTEGYPADGYFKDGKYHKTAENDIYSTESLAKFAYSIFYRAVRFSEENNVPVILDF